MQAKRHTRIVPTPPICTLATSEATRDRLDMWARERKRAWERDRDAILQHLLESGWEAESLVD